MRLIAVLTIVWLVASVHSVEGEQGAEVVSFYGYKDCIRLKNKTTQVTLCPAAGGRVLEYALHGKNALYLPPGEEGWEYKPGKKGGAMAAGRFDIGPEQMVPARTLLWKGRWEGRIAAPYTAELTSRRDPSTGVQLVRVFQLDPKSSQLTCRQTIVNISDSPKEYCHWSRTFAVGNGIVLIPLTRPTRFPHHYVMYGPGPAIDFRPKDDQIRIRDGFLEILGAPKYPKLGMDTYAGWFSYVMPNDLMFVKRFPTYRDRVYNEVAGLTMSIWYPDKPMCELEPIGPRERLAPGEKASFIETWDLLPFSFPKNNQRVDLQLLQQRVKSLN